MRGGIDQRSAPGAHTGMQRTVRVRGVLIDQHGKIGATGQPGRFALLVAVNLQTSFLTPPFGYALFYLKGIAIPGVTTADIYRGVVPIVLMQLLGVVLVALFPAIALWLPGKF